MSENKYESGLDPLTSEADDIAVETLIERTVPSSPSVSEGVINDIFAALSSPEQRYILTYLLRSDGEITITDLVDYAISRTDDSGSETEFRRRLTAELTHTHLPELAEAGFIEYNMERQLVRTSKRTSMIEPYLKIALAQQSTLAERAEE